MKLTIIAVGNRMPGWVNQAVSGYATRMPSHLRLDLVEIAPASRRNKFTVQRAMEIEAEKIARAVPAVSSIVALDRKGMRLSTEDVAAHINDAMMEGTGMTFVIGGPEGIHPTLIRRANLCWSLSDMVIAHAVVRVVLAEQLYRAWTVIDGHPYHRSG